MDNNKSNSLFANFNGRKNIKWNLRHLMSQHPENKAVTEAPIVNKEEVKEIVPENIIVKNVENKTVLQEKVIKHAKAIRIAKIITQVEVEFCKTILPKDVAIIVEFDDDTLNLAKPTFIECDTSVLGNVEMIVHYNELTCKGTAKVIRPKVVE